MQWIGITGPMGGGKSTVAELLRQAGLAVLDADQIVHQLLSPGGKAEAQVLATFGESLRNSQGALDRKALGQLVFGDASRLAQLESILHPLVREHVATERQRLEKAGASVAFYDVPLLYEKSMQGQFDLVLVVSADEAIRRTRVQKRSHLTDSEFDARMYRQISAEQKEKMADVLIRNDGDLNALKQALRAALSKLGIALPAAT